MKRIAFIAHGPGTANALFPLIRSLRANKNVELGLFAFHPYTSRLWNSTMFLEHEFTSIFTEQWDLIITGTGSMHKIEKNAPVMAKRSNIPLLSILDSWGNYEERYQSIPDYLVCMSDAVKIQLIELGISEHAIYSFGNPHFDRLDTLSKHWRVEPPYDVVFFSQPHLKSREAYYYLMQLKDTHPHLLKTIYVTPHPREDETWLKEITSTEPNVIYKHYEHSFELLLQTDVSYGHSSTLQFESEIIQKPTVFYQDYNQIVHDFVMLPFQTPKRSIVGFNATDLCLSLISNILNTDIKI
jgi:hypothetical protein